MVFTFLGTGTSQGVPVIGCDCSVCQSEDPRDKRLRSSLMAENKGSVIVIDAGPDFRQQMLREKVKKLDAILLTHGHKDHTGGLDDVRAFNFLQKRPLDLYGREEVLDIVQHEFSYAFQEDKYPGVPQIELIRVDHNPFTINGLGISPIEVLHNKMIVLGFRINKLTYITDASYIDPSEIEKIRGTEVFIINALRRKTHHSHFNLDEALKVIAEVGPRKAYLTHIGHTMGTYEELIADLPANVFPAYDGLKIVID